MQLLEEHRENAVALHWLQAALKQHPYDRQLTEALAEALVPAGMTEEAVTRYESIIKKDPTRIQSWLGLWQVHASRTAPSEQGLLPKSSVD